MNKYESVIIIKPTLEKNERNEVMDKYQNIMKEFSGKDVKIEDLGMKKLAYQIQNQTYFSSAASTGAAAASLASLALRSLTPIKPPQIISAAKIITNKP